MTAAKSRYRLYTSLKSYLAFTWNMLTGGDASAAARLEERLRGFFGSREVVLTPMCRTGIYLTIRHMVAPGKDVIMSPYTIADVVNMVIAAGAKPRFADIDRDTTNISAASVASLIDANTGAVLITHLHGIPAPVFEIKALCAKHGVPLLEDTAQAFGTRVTDDNGEEHRLGTIGDAGIISLGTYKNINAWFGGAVMTDREDLAAAIREQLEGQPRQTLAFVMGRVIMGAITDIATHPWIFPWFTFWIFRYAHLNDVEFINRFVRTELDLERHDDIPAHYLHGMNPAQCSLALAQVDQIDADIILRRQRAQRYEAALTGINNLMLPPAHLTDEAMYTYYPVQCEDMLDLQTYLIDHGCDIGPQHLHNCAGLPSFDEFAADCPGADKTAREVLLLPTYPGYPLANVDMNIELIRQYFSADETAGAANNSL